MATMTLQFQASLLDALDPADHTRGPSLGRLDDVRRGGDRTFHAHSSPGKLERRETILIIRMSSQERASERDLAAFRVSVRSWLAEHAPPKRPITDFTELDRDEEADAVADARRFQAALFDAGFAGGVRVAAADVNGDGRADIIAGAGPGGAPHVRVFSGLDLSPLSSFFAFEPEFTGGVFVAAATIPEPALLGVTTLMMLAAAAPRRPRRKRDHQ